MKNPSKIPLPLQILLTVLLLGVGIIGGLIALLLLVLMGFPVVLQVLLLLAEALVVLFLFLKIWGMGKPRLVNLTILPLILLTLLAAGGYQAYRLYDQSIPKVEDEVNLWQYIPYPEYSSSGPEVDRRLIPREKASLQLEGELPRLDGATALYPIYAALAEAVYPEGEYPSPYAEDGVVICSTTPNAYERLIAGKADLIFVSGPSDQQLQEAKAAGVELELTAIGKEAFVFFVNQKNPVDNLTTDELRGIYSGKITNWSQVGGDKSEIRAFQRPEGSGSQTALQRLMGDTPLMQPLETEVISGMGEILNRIAGYKNYPNAIGYSFRFFATEMVEQNEIRLLQIDGIYPDAEMVRNESYPVTMPFYAVSRRGEETESLQRLKAWLLSEEGQLLIEQTGYLPL